MDIRTLIQNQLKTTFYVCTSICGYRTTVFVNGAPIIQSEPAFPCIAYTPVTEWVMNGTNNMSVLVTGDGTHNGQHAGNELESLSRLDVRLCRSSLGAIPDENCDENLAVIQWDHPSDMQYPRTLSVELEARHTFGSWVWEDGERISLNKATTTSAVDLLERIHRAMSNRQVEDVLSLLGWKFRDMAECYGMTVEQAADKTRKAFTELFTPDEWALASLDQSQFDFQLCCNSRILELKNRDQRPTIRQRGVVANQEYFLPMFVSSIAGQLVVVR